METFRNSLVGKDAEARARLYVREDGLGDVDCGMEGVTALNALSLLGPLLFLSGRLLDVYLGRS